MVKNKPHRLCIGAMALMLAAAPALAQTVAINEIHYNPPGSGDNEEFLEFVNYGDAPVDMSNWSVSDGIVFTFPPGTTLPPGGYLVVAKVPSALQAATGYSGALQWTSGSLENAGERVAISDQNGVLVDEVTYDDNAPWPTEPDGDGPSLELIRPTLPNHLARCWRPSTTNHGTPGAQNSVYSPNPIVVSEFPARGTLVAGLGAVLVTFSDPVVGVTADDLHVNGSAATAVSGAGAGPYSFSGFAQPMTSIVSIQLASGGIESASGHPFAGDAWTIAVDAPRIVINEIHYHPSDLEDPDQTTEFLELANADSEPVDLSGWAISDGVVFTFPNGTVVAPGGYIVIAKDSAALQARTGYAGALQWLSGSLNNAGERVTIVNSIGAVIDSVLYGDRGAWPRAADGDGPSLELINPAMANQYGQAWRASLIPYGTPGAQNSVYQSQPAPLVVETAHVPAIPVGNQSVLIRTVVLDDTPGVTVTLHYRPDQDPPVAYSSMPMSDDGTSGDEAPGDNLYAATLPGLPYPQRYDFYITADDGVSVTTFPSGHTTLDQWGQPSQTLLCQFSDLPVPTDHPAYHILVRQFHRTIQQNQVFPDRGMAFDATFIDGSGNIYYNVSQRYRGQSSLFAFPESYRVDFASDNRLMSPMGFPVRALLLNSQSPVRQSLGMSLFEDAGIPASRHGFVRLRVNDINYDVAYIQANNGFNGVYVAMERLDNDFLDSQNGAVQPDRELSSDGNLYRGNTNAGLEWRGPHPDAYRADIFDMFGYTKENNESADDWSDLIHLCDRLNNVSDAEFPAAAAAVIDEDEWLKWFAVHMVLGNREGGLYRDTGDDYFLWMSPDPQNYDAKLLPWDMDSVLREANETIWRTTVPTPARFLRHNAFAPRFVTKVREFLAGPFAQAALDARIDALPDSLFPASGGDDLVPQTRQQYKNWAAARRAFIDAEIVTEFTLDLGGIPTNPYTASDPVITIGGTLDQANTYQVTVNDVPVSHSAWMGTWTHEFTLVPGQNTIIARAFGAQGQVLSTLTQTVLYEPTPHSLRLTIPTRMVNSKTVTLKAELLDSAGAIFWRGCDGLGSVAMRRVSDQSDVPVSVVVFDLHNGPPPEDSIAFVHGVGSVSLTLDNGAAEAPGDVEVIVTVGALSASRIVTVLDENQPNLFRDITGPLSGADLTWGPDDGVIRLSGVVSVPNNQTLTILPGTLIMAESGGLFAGARVEVSGRVSAIGTADEPIFFFPAAGPAAMALEMTQDSNPNSWQGLQHLVFSETSTYAHCIFTGAGNGPYEGHPRPSLLAFRSGHSANVSDCTFVDNPGKCISSHGGGHFDIRRNLFSRCGHGNEYTLGNFTLLVEDCWFVSLGHGPEPLNLDGDCLNIRMSNQPDITVRGCVFVDGGDDGIDTSGTSPRIESCIIRDIVDKGVSLDDGGAPTFFNVLIHDAAIGIRLENDNTALIQNCTIGHDVPTPILLAGASEVRESIVWPGILDTCGPVTFNHNILGVGSNLGCGTGNVSDDPLFVNPPDCDYDLTTGSPALTAGPLGGRIGWLGFPRPSVATGTVQLRTGAEPDSVCATLGQPLNVDVRVTDLTAPVNAARLRVAFDQTRLALVSATPADGWQISEFTVIGGDLTYVAGRAVGGETGPATIATLVFNTIAVGDASVTWRADSGADVTQLTVATGGPPIGGAALARLDAGAIGIHVEPRNALVADVQLAGVVAPSITRCLTFEFYNCPTEQPILVVDQPVTFVDGTAHAVTVPLPCGSMVTCVAVRDRLHTLRRVVNPLPTSGGVYVADLTGARAMLGGNLNDDEAIDMLDFAELVLIAGSNYGGGDTTCATVPPHGDVDGDGVAFAADFSFIAAHLNEVSELTCCASPLQGGIRPVDSISIAELKARGLEHLAAADLNGDGVLDRRDLAALGGSRGEKR